MTTYSLELNAFSIEFDVHGNFSVDETSSRHYPDAPNFVYAGADIWVSFRGVRHFVISKFATGNLIETLHTFGKKLRSISTTPTLSGNIKIPRGGWCDWMREYWDRIDRDCSTPDDEENYELLIPFDLISGRGGHFCAYLYDGVPTLLNTFLKGTVEQQGQMFQDYANALLTGGNTDAFTKIANQVCGCGK